MCRALSCYLNHLWDKERARNIFHWLASPNSKSKTLWRHRKVMGDRIHSGVCLRPLSLEWGPKPTEVWLRVVNQGLVFGNPYLLVSLFYLIAEECKAFVHMPLAWPWTLFFKRTLLRNLHIKQIKAMRSSSRNLKPDCLWQVSHCLQVLWSPSGSAVLKPVLIRCYSDSVCSTVCLILPHYHSVGLAE